MASYAGARDDDTAWDADGLHAPIQPPVALPGAAHGKTRARPRRPVPGSRVTPHNAASVEAQWGPVTSLKVAWSAALGFTDRALSVVASFDPTGQFFEDGTGDLERLRAHENEFLGRLLSNRRTPAVDVVWDSRRVSTDGEALVRTGHFLSPVAHLLPPEAANARVQLITPANRDGKTVVRGVVLHFAATADQTFVLRRRLLAQPLLKHGIASVLLMPAYYGSRRPAAQTLHFTRTLADFCVLTHSMICEGASLLDWISDTLLAPGKEFGGARLGVTGVSMGGAMAAIVAAMTLHPVAVSPCLGTWTGAGVYTSGALAPQVAWRSLAREPGVASGPGGPRGHVRRVLEHNDIDVIVAALNAAPSRPSHGPRALVMCNAVHDKYVDPSEAQHLFRVLAPTCAPGDAVQRWISGGHVTAVLGSTPEFVTACVESFDLLDTRLAALEARELDSHHAVQQRVPPHHASAGAVVPAAASAQMDATAVAMLRSRL